MNPVLCEKTRVPLWVDADDPIVSQHLLQTGDWDAPLADILEAALNPDDVFLDLGAHVGYFSMVAAPHCKRVIAVEPQKELAALIRRNGVENIQVIQLAVGLHRGIFPLSVPINRGAASFNHEDGNEEWVEVDKLGNLANGATVAKVDIEGDDYDLMAGNPWFLEQLRMIVFEYPEGSDAYWHLIQNAGFTIYAVDGGGKVQTEPPELPEGFYTNLVGVRVL